MWGNHRQPVQCLNGKRLSSPNKWFTMYYLLRSLRTKSSLHWERDWSCRKISSLVLQPKHGLPTEPPHDVWFHTKPQQGKCCMHWQHGEKHPQRCSAHAPVTSPCADAPNAASPSPKPQGRSADLLPCPRFPCTGMRAERAFPLGQHLEPMLNSAMSHSERLPQRHRCRAEAQPASCRGQARPGRGQSHPPRLLPSLRCPRAALRHAAQLGNSIVVPSVCSVCWDFTGDDKWAQHLVLEIYNRKTCRFPHFENICYELMIQLIPTITDTEEKRLAEHPTALTSLLLFCSNASASCRPKFGSRTTHLPGSGRCPYNCSLWLRSGCCGLCCTEGSQGSIYRKCLKEFAKTDMYSAL